MASGSSSLLASDLFSVTGKIIVITGGGTGLGRMMAEGLVINGAKVYIIGRRAEMLEKAVREINAESVGEGQVFSIEGDISTKAGVQAINATLKSKVDKVDVLINNAGLQRPWKHPITDHNDPDLVEKLVWEGVGDEDWNMTNAVNINGVYFLTAALVPLLRKSEIKSVIIISSIAAMANQRQADFNTDLWGVKAVHLAAMLAGRLSPLKIRVNTICPGAFPSEITMSPDGTLLPGAHKAALRSPAGRAGRREEIIGPVMLLASAAGGYMNNAVITVDGGRLMNAGINDGVRLPEETYP